MSDAVETELKPAAAQTEDAAEHQLGLMQLSFPDLCIALDRYLTKADRNKAGPLERWSFAIGLFGAGVGLLLGNLLANQAGVRFAIGGLVIELAGLGISLALQIKRELPGFRQPHKIFADEIERDFQAYRGLIQQVRAFPLRVRLQRERYIRDRRATMHERLGLFTGGIERLGVMPVLVALYLQFKDWEWGDWTSLGKVTFVQGMLIWALFISYLLSWHLIRLRTRVHSYELLLREANEPSD